MTFGEMRDEILNDLDRPELSAETETAIKRAVFFHGAERFWFNETRAYTFDLVAGQAEYTLSADTDEDIQEFVTVDYMMIQIGGVWYFLEREDPIDVEYIQSGQTTLGQPSSWSYYGSKFRFDPVPDTNAYVVRVAGHYRLTELSGDNDENVWTTQAPGLILAHAKKLVYGRVIRDQAMAAVFAEDEAMELQRLRLDTIKRQGQGTIRGWW